MGEARTLQLVAFLREAGNAPLITADRLSGTLDRGPIAAAPTDTGLDSLYQLAPESYCLPARVPESTS